jgi:hypothetical protein
MRLAVEDAARVMRHKGADVKKPAPRSRKAATASSHDALDTVAIQVGKSIGTAMKGTRALREGLKTLGTTIVDAGSRAGEMIKQTLPTGTNGKNGKNGKQPTAKAARARKASKTVAPPPAHGEDPLTHEASPKTKRSTKQAASAAVDARRRASVARRG